MPRSCQTPRGRTQQEMSWSASPPLRLGGEPSPPNHPGTGETVSTCRGRSSVLSLLKTQGAKGGWSPISTQPIFAPKACPCQDMGASWYLLPSAAYRFPAPAVRVHHHVQATATAPPQPRASFPRVLPPL